MTSSFPTVYVDKEDPEYQGLPMYQFVLIQHIPPHGRGLTPNS